MTLSSRFARPPIVVAPGVYDALTAALATEPARRRCISPAPASPTRGSAGPTSASSP